MDYSRRDNISHILLQRIVKVVSKTLSKVHKIVYAYQAKVCNALLLKLLAAIVQMTAIQTIKACARPPLNV